MTGLARACTIAGARPNLLVPGMESTFASAPPGEESRSFCLVARGDTCESVVLALIVGPECRLASLLLNRLDRHLVGWDSDSFPVLVRDRRPPELLWAAVLETLTWAERGMPSLEQ